MRIVRADEFHSGCRMAGLSDGVAASGMIDAVGDVLKQRLSAVDRTGQKVRSRPEPSTTLNAEVERKRPSGGELPERKVTILRDPIHDMLASVHS